MDRAALEALYRAEEGPLYNVVYRWIWRREEAMEIVQEAFTRLWRMRDRIRPETARALLYRVALNLAASRRRWAKAKRFVGLEGAANQETGAPDAEDRLMATERSQAIRAAVEALPEKLRRVIMLCELGEMSYAEVAHTLQIPEGTVASRRNAALAKLRATLGEGMTP